MRRGVRCVVASCSAAVAVVAVAAAVAVVAVVVAVVAVVAVVVVVAVAAVVAVEGVGHAARRILAPKPGREPLTLQWKHRARTPGPPGRRLHLMTVGHNEENPAVQV